MTTPTLNDFAFVPQGASFSRTYSSVLDETGATVTDFTGWTFAGAIKTAISDADNAALITIADGSFTRGTGEVGFILTPATMAALTVGPVYHFAVKAQSPNGFVDTIDELRIQITRTARQAI
jgi:hypothetical protein